METALSQYEVEALMNALGRGGTPRPARAPVNPATVKPYDFRRPDKLSKDHIRTLQMIHETFARLLSSSLSAYLRIPVHVQLLDIEQSSSDEYITRIPTPTILSLVSLRPLSGNAVLELSVEVAFAVLDRLLGGQGNVFETQREVTDIELSLLESVCGTIVTSLQDAWRNLVTFEAEVEDTSLHPQFIQRALPNDSMVVFSFHLRVQEVEGVFRLAIPYTTLEPVAGKLNAQFWFARGRDDDKTMAAELRERLERASVPVRVVLGRAVVTVRELSELQPGDVINLNTFTDQELEVYVGMERKFRARPGLRGNRVAVQITQIDESSGILGAIGALDEQAE